MGIQGHRALDVDLSRFIIIGVVGGLQAKRHRRPECAPENRINELVLGILEVVAGLDESELSLGDAGFGFYHFGLVGLVHRLHAVKIQRRKNTVAATPPTTRDP